MQKRLAGLSVVAAMALPISLEASSVCAVNAFGQFFRFELKDRCRAGTNSMGPIFGRWYSGFVCNGSGRLPLHGTCTGDPETAAVVVTIISEASNNGCLQATWHMNGSAVNDSTGVYDNAPLNGGDNGDTWTPADCADEPPLGTHVAEPVGPGLVPGRQ